MNSQFVISIQDLQFVTLFCRHCNTRVTLDLDAEFEKPRTAFLCPTECPRCGTAFDSAIAPAVEAMQRVYKALTGLGDAVSFAAPAPAPPAKQ